MTGDEIVPGEIIPAEEPVTINEGRETTTVTISNTGDRPIQIGSHFHFFEVNKALEFDREQAFGMRLDLPAGASIRVEPGEDKEVDLVELGGTKRVTGLNSLTEGSLRSESGKKEALRRAKKKGFKWV